MSKWREFWLASHHSSPDVLIYIFDQPVEGATRVIEYAAYEELKAEVERLKEKNRRLVEEKRPVNKRLG